MTQHPFEGAPSDQGGSFDMGALLQQAQQLQQQLESAQKRLTETTVNGTVAGGSVVVTVTGVGELVGVQIKAGGFDGTDPEDLTDLGDLIVAAYRDAKAQADAVAAEALGPLAGGLPEVAGIPGLPDIPGQPGAPGQLGY